MTEEKLQPQVVSKEDVANFHFPHEDVLTDAAEKIARADDAKKAASLGNTEKFKIKIIFGDNEGTKQVETTIWAAGPENIVLKQGVFIPVHRIYKMKLL